MTGFRLLTALGVFTWLAALVVWLGQPAPATDYAFLIIGLLLGATSALIDALWVARGYPRRRDARRWVNRNDLAFGAAAAGVACLYLVVDAPSQVDAFPLAFGFGWLTIAVWRAITLRSPSPDEGPEQLVPPTGDEPPSGPEMPWFVSWMLRAIALTIAGGSLYLATRIEVGGILLVIAAAFITSLLWDLSGKQSA